MKAFSLFFLVLIITMSSCYKEVFITPGEGLEDWESDTHSSLAKPNYDIVFNQNKVHRLDIVISEKNWSLMQDNLESILGSSSRNTRPVGGPPNGGGGEMSFSEETPVYVPSDVFYNNVQWYNVGIRFKGNSSLSGSYSRGINKCPFRLEFNYFEDDYPNIKGQTFYGFQQLALANNFDDQSLMREKAATALFREFGVPAPYTAFYELYINIGNGPVYFGLYTMDEIVFDTMLEKQFGSNSGNCYKPENDGAMFSEFGFNTSDFENKTNSSLWDDVTNMYNILHDVSRTNNVSEWKINLESIFDVDGFLKYLAVNSVIQNWDVYGNMPHNYYLYNDPADNLLKWIPWDNNEAFQDGKRTVYQLNYEGIDSESWPIIPYVLGVSEYEQKYKDYIQDFTQTIFSSSNMQSKYLYYKSLIQESVNAEQEAYTFLSNSSSFENAIDELINHCSERNQVSFDYINE